MTKCLNLDAHSCCRPNGGASFGQGGGAYVALRIAQTLASEADSTVGLVALWGASLGSLSSAFDIKLPIERIKNFFMFSSNSVREPSVNPLFSPYFGAVTLQLLRFVQRVIH